MPLTSLSSPLVLDRIPVAGRPGTLSLTICPGQKDEGWDRDLAIDLAALRAAGVRHVIYLLEDAELRSLGIFDYAGALRAAGLAPHQLPIPDGGTPGNRGHDKMLGTVDLIRLRLSFGEHVVVHSRGGLGRAGLLAACVLVADRMNGTEAIALVRKHRPRAIETKRQEAFVIDFGGWLDRKNLRRL